AVMRIFYAFGDEAIGGQRLVEAARHQAVEQLARFHEVVAEADERDALEDEGVEVVEGADVADLDEAALGRVRVDVVEMREVGGVFQRIAVERDAVADD